MLSSGMPFDEPPARHVDLMAMDGHQEYVSLPYHPINLGRLFQTP